MLFVAVLVGSCERPEPRECKEEEELFVFVDADGDGFGSEPLGYVCTVRPDEAINSLDCDDTRADVNPMAEDVCDDVDNDCDGRIDETALRRSWFPDDDGDGFGNPDEEWRTCTEPGDGWVFDNNDCDDDDDGVYPGRPEICGNGIDEDCSGFPDDGIEICNNGVDDDCDGLSDCDDGDCDGSESCTEACTEVVLPSDPVVMAAGSTSGQGNDVNPTCASTFATDVVHQYVVPSNGTYVIDTVGSSFDTVLAVYDDCDPNALLACNDDAVGLQSEVTLPGTAGDVWLVVVDGYSSANGDYELHIELQ